MLQGKVGVLLFDDQGTVVECMELVPQGNISAVELGSNVWHTVFPVSEHAVILDIRRGRMIQLHGLIMHPGRRKRARQQHWIS